MFVYVWQLPWQQLSLSDFLVEFKAVCTGGMSGVWTFVAIPINFLVVYIVLFFFCQSPKEETSLMLVKAAVTSVWTQGVTSLKSSWSGFTTKHG